MGESFGEFLNDFDFDALVEYVSSGEWQSLLGNGYFQIIAVAFLVSIALKRTRGLGTTALQWVSVGTIYGVCGVALKNSHINEIGPFILGLSLAFGVIGYFAYTKLMR